MWLTKKFFWACTSVALAWKVAARRAVVTRAVLACGVFHGAISATPRLGADTLVAPGVRGEGFALATVPAWVD